MGLGHTLQGDGEGDSEAARVHPAAWHAPALLDSETQDGPSPQQGHATTWQWEKSRFRTPEGISQTLWMKPSLSRVSLCHLFPEGLSSGHRDFPRWVYGHSWQGSLPWEGRKETWGQGGYV